MAPKFLCCLPLRLGVAVISFIQFVFCGGTAGLLWWALWSNQAHNDWSEMTKNMKLTVIIVASVYTFATLVSLLGFLGALLKKNGMVKTFYILLCVVLGAQVGSSIWYLITFYRNRGQTLNDCLGDKANDSDRIALCQSMNSFRRVPQGVLIASVAVPILLQAYACYVVHQYSNRLTQQKAEKLRQSAVFNQARPTYQPVPVSQDHESYPLTQPTGGYPYADASHSFGHKA
ncbi:hypothetical protein BJ165DRAFT_1525231 [Panaeolus papilionaceus]|nr:hypothetical protein BJ165DRAFT_1525231 [Panaeolus papilionaceus]